MKAATTATRCEMNPRFLGVWAASCLIGMKCWHNQPPYPIWTRRHP